MKEALIARMKEKEWDMPLDKDVLKGFLPEIQQAYDTRFPIYKVTFIADEEGRANVLFAFCSGEKEDIKKLVDHASSLMGPRDEMVYFWDTSLEEAVKDWFTSLRHFEQLIEMKKFYLKGSYPRTEDIVPYPGRTWEVTKDLDEQSLLRLGQTLQFLKETGPVFKVKPSREEQICPHCLKVFREGREQKVS